MNRFFDADVFQYEFPRILARFPITLQIVLVATVAGLLLGAGLAFVRIRRTPVLSPVAGVFISYIRGVPVLVQLFVIYYGLPMILREAAGIDTRDMDKMIFIHVTYGLNQAGFMAENMRSSVKAVPAGQWEAGYASGLTGFQTFSRIVVPQAARVAIPSFETGFVALFRSTTLAYMVGIADMMGQVRVLSNTTFRTIEGYICVMIIQVVISLLLERLFGLLNRKLRFGKKI